MANNYSGNMGIGRLGDQDIILKRKFRYELYFDGICGGKTIPPDFVKLAARPNITIEETELNYLNGKTWIPGKATLETLSVTYYDPAVKDNEALWSWLATIYDFTDNVKLHQASRRRDYSGTGNLVLYDGCGEAVELWILGDCWPQAINWGELANDATEECNIEVTFRYGKLEYHPLCPQFPIKSCCTPCG